MSELELKRVRSTFKSKLTRFKTFVDKLTSDSSTPSLDEKQIIELKRRLEQTLPLLSEFERCENNLNLLSQEETIDHFQLEFFENAYFEYTAINCRSNAEKGRAYP